MSKDKIHVKSGDTVVVLSGKDKGKKGKILRGFPTDKKVLIEGVNMIKRHTRPSQQNPQGGIVEQESPIYADKVMLFCSSCNRPVRTANKVTEKGNKQRVCKKCDAEL